MEELNRITIDPEICMGQPTIRGMRITVSTALKMLASKMNTEEIIGAYPELEKEDIIQSISYAEWISSKKVKYLPTKEIIGV